MAKKKRNRPQSSGRPGTQPHRGASAGVREPLPRVAPAEPGGPNRLARKEEARRQREALRRKMARRRRYRIGAAALAVVLVAGGITAYALTRPEPFRVAGCSGVETIGALPPEEDRRHITSPVNSPDLSTYPSVPPTSGPHAGTALPSGVYDQPQDIYRAIHSLEHGAVIVWYRPGLSSADLQRIKDFYRSPAAGDHVIVAPYDYPDQSEAGQLPAGQQIALAAWHRLQTCERAHLGAVQAFVDGYRTPAGVPNPDGYKGDAPEPGAGI